LVLLNAPSTTETYTLSLHDALPIWETWPEPGASCTLCRRTPTPRPWRCSWRCTGTSTGYSTMRNSAYCSHSPPPRSATIGPRGRSEEHTSELQSRFDLVCRLLLEKK